MSKRGLIDLPVIHSGSDFRLKSLCPAIASRVSVTSGDTPRLAGGLPDGWGRKRLTVLSGEPGSAAAPVFLMNPQSQLDFGTGG